MAQKKTRTTKKKKSGGNDSGGKILLKAIVFLLLVLLVFGLLSWGLEKLDEKNQKDKDAKANVTQTPTGKGGKSGDKEPTNPGESTKPTQGEPEDPDPTETPTPTVKPQDTAKAVLMKISKDKLKLAKEISEYTLEVDDYTSIIRGHECVGVNVLDSDGVRVGAYYVKLDGSLVLRELDDEDFESIVP